MSGFTRFAGFLLRLARWIAGAQRRDWILAMATETDAAGDKGMRWALGCLFAAAQDRLARDRWFFAALLTLPALALVLAAASAMLFAFIASHLSSVPPLPFVLLVLIGPLPAAWLLGRMRPDYPPIAVGTVAFAEHQAIPLIAMWWMTGRLPPFWTADMTYYNLPATIGLLTSYAGWIGATWWGAATRRHAAA